MQILPSAETVATPCAAISKNVVLARMRLKKRYSEKVTKFLQLISMLYRMDMDVPQCHITRNRVTFYRMSIILQCRRQVK